jgi:hypothetical protein
VFTVQAAAKRVTEVRHVVRVVRDPVDVTRAVSAAFTVAPW